MLQEAQKQGGNEILEHFGHMREDIIFSGTVSFILIMEVKGIPLLDCIYLKKSIFKVVLLINISIVYWGNLKIQIKLKWNKKVIITSLKRIITTYNQVK